MQLKFGRISSIVLLACLVFVDVSDHCRAQLFGERSVGGQGMLSGNERFVRGNRSRRDFVGSNRSDQAGFVGAQQALATGRVRTATEGLRIDQSSSSRRNRPISPLPASGLYHPKLEVDWNLSGRQDQAIQARFTETHSRLLERVRRIGGSNLRLSLEDSTAVLTGSVDSNSKSELLEQILLFEPGIEDIRNDLQIDAGQ